MLTIAEVLDGGVGEAHVRVGALDAAVERVHLCEAADPRPQLRGGELVVTSGRSLATATTQRRFVTALVARGSVGLVLGVGGALTHSEAPAALVAAAEEAGLALVELPDGAFGRLVADQHELLQDAIAALDALQALVLERRGLEAILGALAAEIDGSVLVLDRQGRLIGGCTTPPELAGELVDALDRQLHARAGAHGAADAPPTLAPEERALLASALVLPIAVGPAVGAGTSEREPEPGAWLVSVKDAEPLRERDRLVLAHGVRVVALELQARRTAELAARPFEHEAIVAMVGGELSGVALARRLEPFGLHERVSAIVLAPTGPAARRAATAAACEQLVREVLVEQDLAGIVGDSGRFVCALVPGLPDDDLFALANRIVDRCPVEVGPGVPVAVGAGRAVAAVEAAESFHEARCALEARRVIAARDVGAPAATRWQAGTYRDLGSVRLLLSLQRSEVLRLFCDSLLGPLQRGDGEYADELVRTVEAFIECNGQSEMAAKRLFCHRNTLRYRLRKIEQLTGRDLSSAGDRFELWMALRARELVEASGRGPRSHGALPVVGAPAAPRVEPEAGATDALPSPRPATGAQ